MTRRHTVAVIGSGFAGSLMARVLAVLGHQVILLERGTHPRFAIGESTTPLANLSLERLSRRYGLEDCYQLAAHGRWLDSLPGLRRGLKRGFTFYRHHPGVPFDIAGLDSERLLVAASPNDDVADSHWMRSDVDHHFVHQAVAAGVDYRDGVELATISINGNGVRLTGRRSGVTFELDAEHVIDASGPGGFLAQQLEIPSGLHRAKTHSGVVFSHFSGVRPIAEVLGGLPEGPYPDDLAAVHHIVDEGWMYALRFDDGVTSAGFALSKHGMESIPDSSGAPADLWHFLLRRYPALSAAFADAQPLMPVVFRSRIQHRLTQAVGPEANPRWMMLPHAYAFTDPLFSTGIAWSLRAVERLALCFEDRAPSRDELNRYERLLSAEADQIDYMVAAAYEGMTHFDLFAAHAMIYFATVSFAETHQRLARLDGEAAAWSGFLGAGDVVLGELPSESYRRLRHITGNDRGHQGTSEQRRDFGDWVAAAIAPRNVGGFGDRARHNLYPIDLELLIDRHALLQMTRQELLAALPALRGYRSSHTENPDGTAREPMQALRPE
jgi:FADH2 O2-dependent halogenase